MHLQDIKGRIFMNLQGITGIFLKLRDITGYFGLLFKFTAFYRITGCLGGLKIQLNSHESANMKHPNQCTPHSPHKSKNI